jgi:nitrogen regulatory protein P-II 2
VKLITAIIQPDRLDDVVEELTQAEINLMTVSDVMGRGRQKGVAEVYRSHVEPGGLLRKVQVEIAVNDEFVQPAIDAVIRGARTGNIGDGKIFVTNLEQCVRIRTGETGGLAIG